MSPVQKDVFLNEEGDGWFTRNQISDEDLAEKVINDPILQLIETSKFSPKDILEIGASDGWRLAALKKYMPQTINFTGIEPSAEAVKQAADGIDMLQGTADTLPFPDHKFDLIIFGFCLYLCDRADLFKIAAEVDRVLSDQGHLIIYDFSTETPYKNPYAHVEGMYSYKMNYSKLFTWNPYYSVKHEALMPHPGTQDMSPDNIVGLTLLQKSLEKAWPDNPHKPKKTQE